MKIVVLAGGLCSERNVSIVSGTKVYDALKEKGHSVVLLDVFTVFVITLSLTAPSATSIDTVPLQSLYPFAFLDVCSNPDNTN